MNINSRKQAIRFNYIARRLLFQLNIDKPTRKQVAEMRALISTIYVPIEKKLVVHDILSEKEGACLLLIAHGNSSAEISTILEIRKNTVRTYRERIMRKLKCSSISQAIFKGIQYEVIKKTT